MSALYNSFHQLLPLLSNTIFSSSLHFLLYSFIYSLVFSPTLCSGGTSFTVYSPPSSWCGQTILIYSFLSYPGLVPHKFLFDILYDFISYPFCWLFYLSIQPPNKSLCTTCVIMCLFCFRCASNIKEVTDSCLSGLVSMLNNKDGEYNTGI